MAEKFNPAVYVQQKGGKKYLPLAAKLAWLAYERPGWRIVADKEMTIVSVPDIDDEGTPYKKGVAIGAVSLIDDKGVRVQTVRVDANAAEEGFASNMFMEGSELLLNSIGYSLERIPKSCWQEYLSVFGMEGKTGIQKNDSTSQSEVLAEDSPDAIIPAEPDTLPENDDIMTIFQKLLKERPGAIPGFVPGVSPDDPAALDRLFDRYCFSTIGEGWESMDENGQSKVKERIMTELRGDM